MASLTHGQPVQLEHRVLRLPPKDYQPPGWVSTHELLQPNSGDERTAGFRREPVRVSVWDLEVCTLAQAVAFREGYTLMVAYRSTPAAIVAVDPTIGVVYDALDPPDADRPGADGHAGIEGLTRRKPLESKPQWRDRLATIAQTFLVHE